MSELELVVDFHQRVKERFPNYCIYLESKTDIADINDLFKTASKTSSGHIGRPDMLIYNKDSNYIIIVECKRDKKYVRSTYDNKPVDFAVDGTLHYMKYTRNKFHTIGVSLAGMPGDIDAYVSFSYKYSVNVPITFNIEYKSVLDYLSPLKINISRLIGDDIVLNKIHHLPVNINILSSKDIKLPEYQRPVDANKIRSIYENICTQWRLSKCVEFLDKIFIAIYNNNFFILDGQHRLQAFRKFYDENGGYINGDVCLFVRNYTSKLDIKQDFRTLNLGSTASEIDLSDDILTEDQVADVKPADDKQINIIVNAAVNKYIEADSKRKLSDKLNRVPHITTERLKSKLLDKINKKEIADASTDDIYNFIIEKDKYIAGLSTDNLITLNKNLNKKTLDKHLKTCGKQKCYLGLLDW
jgi:hypothetical protein